MLHTVSALHPYSKRHHCKMSAASARLTEQDASTQQPTSSCLGVQMVVEKSLAAEGTSRQEIGREAFTQRVWDWRRLYVPLLWQRLG